MAIDIYSNLICMIDWIIYESWLDNECLESDGVEDGVIGSVHQQPLQNLWNEVDIGGIHLQVPFSFRVFDVELVF